MPSWEKCTQGEIQQEQSNIYNIFTNVTNKMEFSFAFLSIYPSIYQHWSAAEIHKLKAVSKAVLPPAQPMVGKEKSPWTGVFCDLAAIPV